jgi:hypothetical protein
MKVVAGVKVMRLGHFERAQVVPVWVSTVVSRQVPLAGDSRHSVQVRAGYLSWAAEEVAEVASRENDGSWNGYLDNFPRC